MSRMCDGKVRYETRLEAIHQGLAYTKHSGHGVRVYECPICKGYHLTTHAEDGKSLKNRFIRNDEEEAKASRDTKTASDKAV